MWHAPPTLSDWMQTLQWQRLHRAARGTSMLHHASWGQTSERLPSLILLDTSVWWSWRSHMHANPLMDRGHLPFLRQKIINGEGEDVHMQHKLIENGKYSSTVAPPADESSRFHTKLHFYNPSAKVSDSDLLLTVGGMVNINDPKLVHQNKLDESWIIGWRTNGFGCTRYRQAIYKI